MADITLIHDCDLERLDSIASAIGFDETELQEQVPGQIANGTSARGGYQTIFGKGENEGVEYSYHAIFLYDLRLFIPASATLVSAVWHYYVTDADPIPGHTFHIERVTRTDWVEGQATWLDYKTATYWTTPGGDVSTPDIQLVNDHTTTGWKSHDITSMVTDAWDNRGRICTFLLDRLDTQTIEGYIGVRTKSGWEGDPPSNLIHHLRITYTLDGRTLQVMVR